MYKGTSENAQRRRDALIPSNLMNGEEVQTDEDRRRNLVRLVQRVERAIKTTGDTALKKRLGIKKLEIQNRLKEMQPKKARPGLEEHFVESAKEMLPPALFRTILTDARKKWDAAQAEANEEPGDVR